jgi:cell division protein FtsB
MTPDPAATPARAAAPRARRRLETVREQRDLRRRLWSWGLTIGMVVLLVNAVVGENGYLATLRVRQEKGAEEAEVARLRIANAALQDETRRIMEDPAALEEAARRTLGLMREGETMIVIRDAAPDVHPPAPSTGK